VTYHDPREFVESLRDHLATHDRPVLFLFGAGTSCAINVAPDPPPGEEPQFQPLIPGTDELTAHCRDSAIERDEEFGTAWELLTRQAEGMGRPGNVEDILTSVRGKIGAIGEGETLVGLNQAQLQELESVICETIAKLTCPPAPQIPKRIPHDGLAIWIRRIGRSAPLEIFTTNYDVLLEHACEKARVPVFDGFVGAHNPFFFPECLSNEELLPKPKWLRLWKIHGSVNWGRITIDGRARVVRTAPGTSGEMILPSSRKYDESRKLPYLAYLDRLGHLLNSEHALLVTCGYSFGDEHINAVLFAGLENRNTANIVALCYDDIALDQDLVGHAQSKPNLTVIGPNAAVISGAWGEWRLTNPVTDKTAGFMDVAFDSAARPEAGNSSGGDAEDLQGRMRLGDFVWFARFLEEMDPSADE